jgi:membrane protein YdbS with pleckstrin-like domain
MMSRRAEHLTQWVYEGIWAVLARWFRVPQHPPSLPTPPGETGESFRPAPGFLQYMKFQFWILLILIDAAIAVGWLVILITAPGAGVLLAPIALAVAVVPDVIAYAAIHLRYDTTWYVMTDRSLRIRRGIWIIHETTITFENVQNVSVVQGPLQRWFGIANVRVDTAGGGGRSQEAPGGQSTAAHRGLIEGIAEAPRIRDLILSRLRRSRSAGLGDERAEEEARGFTPRHLAVLREIRDAVRSLPPAAGTG